MAVANLTGTKWLLNSSLNLNIKTAYTINFVSDSANYIYFAIGASPNSEPITAGLYYYTSYYNYRAVYNTYNGGWSSQAYRTIQITGGTDATNTTLITWLESNATQIVVPVRSISLENLNTFKEELELEMSSMALPTTTTAGKVLKSTSTAGTVQWANDTDTNQTVKVGSTTFTASAAVSFTGSGAASVSANNSRNTITITVPTGTSATTVAVGNHTHGYYTKPTGGIPASDLAESYYLASNPSGFTSNTGTVKSVRVQAGTGMSSSTSTAQSTTLNTTISIASGYKLPTTTEWNSKANTSALSNYLERESQDEYGVGFSQNYFYIDLVDQDGNASMAYRFGNSETIGFNITNEDEGGEVSFGTQGFEFITPAHHTTSISYSNIATKTELSSSLGATHWDGAILNLFSDGSGNVVSFYGSLHYLKADRTLSVKGVIRVRAQGSNASSVQEIPITPIYNKLGLSASNVDSTQGLHWIGTGIPWNGTDIVSSVMGAGEIIFLAQGLQTFAIGYISNVNSGELSLLPISSIATASHMVDFMIHFTA